MNGMITVIIPIGLLLIVLLCKKIPVIGGSIHASLALAGFSALIWAACTTPLPGRRPGLRAWIRWPGLWP